MFSLIGSFLLEGDYGARLCPQDLREHGSGWLLCRKRDVFNLTICSGLCDCDHELLKRLFESNYYRAILS